MSGKKTFRGPRSCFCFSCFEELPKSCLEFVIDQNQVKVSCSKPSREKDRERDLILSVPASMLRLRGKPLRLSVQAVALSSWRLLLVVDPRKQLFSSQKFSPLHVTAEPAAKPLRAVALSCRRLLLAEVPRAFCITTFRAPKVCFQLLALHCLAGPAQQPFHLQAVALSWSRLTHGGSGTSNLS